MGRSLSFIFILIYILLALSSSGYRSSDESSKDTDNDKEEYSNYSTKAQTKADEFVASEDENDVGGTDSDEDDGSLDFDNLDDGMYSATVSYYNPETGYSNSYDLDVEVESNEVVEIEFPICIAINLASFYIRNTLPAPL